ncbi:MAG: type II/IV secretion system protein, partial [Spirochaetia bacterium]|nr:type II/IV secretion system protein [Spirochaetia bacterium]
MNDDLLLRYQFFVESETSKITWLVSREKLPLDILDYLTFASGKRVWIKEISPGKVDAWFKKNIYKKGTRSGHLSEGFSGEPFSGDKTSEAIEINYNDAPVVKLVNSLIEDAIRAKASDVHIEPQADGMHTRYRLDGELQTILKSPLSYFDAVSSRVKFLAQLDITNRMTPQDGKARISLGDRELDLRVSTVPTKLGESIVIRILSKEESYMDLAAMGLTSGQHKNILGLLKKQNGLILVTGPTGSGKSTTLYSMIKILNQGKTKILTVEDPIEYEMPSINQVEVNALQGMTFPKVLKHFLRHDPDVIMIGEIRDEETANIAIRASLTGHLVLSTLHTSDTVSALTRLVDLGIEPFQIASSLKAVLSQR